MGRLRPSLVWQKKLDLFMRLNIWEYQCWPATRGKRPGEMVLDLDRRDLSGTVQRASLGQEQCFWRKLWMVMAWTSTNSEQPQSEVWLVRWCQMLSGLSSRESCRRPRCG